MRILLIVAVGLTIVTISGAALIAYQVRSRQEYLAATFQTAVSCNTRQDYACARDGFSVILGEDPSYPGARKGLSEAQFGLAGQYANSGQWQQAIDELDSVLSEDPTDEHASTALKDVYTRWLLDATSKGDWPTVIRLRLQMAARFPPLDQ